MKRYCLFISLLLLSPSVGLAVNLPDAYPRLGNYFLDPDISDSEATELAQWDIVVLGLETHYTSPQAFEIMKAANPDIILLAYVTSEEVPEKHLEETDTNSPIYKLYNQLNSNDDLFLKNTSGDYLNFYPDTRLINVTTEWKKLLPKFMTKQIIQADPKDWDGIFYDNCFNDISWVDDQVDVNQDGEADFWKTADAQWKTGMTKMMKQTRQRNPNKVIICNSNGDFYTYINGRLIEAFPSSFDGGWVGSMEKYYDVLEAATNPSVVIVNTVANSADASNYQLMRYNLTSTLMGDGFASFDQSVDQHHALWWYDEYSVALGAPLNGPYNVSSNAGPDDWSKGVWRRNFDRGIVLVNSSSEDKRVILEDGFEKILGTQDTDLNDGTVVGSVKIPAHDGIILQGRIAQVVDDPYINGTFAKVLSARGKQLRSSFFTYNSAYNGSDTVVQVPEIDTEVVAGSTYVTVYKNGTQVAQFAPYGTSFTGGVNIAVERLEGDHKGYRIVTGTQSGGAQVRIFSSRGQLVNTGCFPYGTDFRGGVNVAVADVLPNKAGKEIVVGAGQGGGPQVLVLNKHCKPTGQSWFAYSSSLRTGVWVAAGDVNNDGKDDIVTIPGAGSAPYVRVFTGRGHEQSPGFYAFSKSNTSGAQVAVSDVDGDGDNELIVMSFAIFNE
ncbi:MAG: VCBS repeat-containing protein [Candidatus Kerfeldbacteria bacterium]|nr:VCBS repeat-containing protein [Candidatus Kerfeldbacteria bacterium]